MITKIDIGLKVLTPLHIGNGQKLTQGFDYVCRNGRTYRLDLDALAEELYARDPKLTEQLLRTPPGQLLKPEDLCPDAPYIRYVLSGTPSGQEFREAIKDPHDRPYIPGSSLKGALRTVLAWHAWRELKLSFSSVHLPKDKKRAAQDVEAGIFGRDPEKGRKSPHHDLLRALWVSDSAPAGTGALGIYQVKVWTKRGGAAPISVEAIKPDTEFSLEITVDEALFSEWSKKEKGFPFRHREWFEELPRLARERTKERLECELAFWEGAGFKKTLSPITSLIVNIDTLRREGNGFPLQLGFGTGWEGTTIGAPLKADPLWPEVHRRYELGKAPRANRQTPPDEYPRSRRVVVGPDERPLQPLGWVWVSWKEVR